MIPADDTTRPRPGTVGPDGPTVDFDRAATTPLRPEARAAMAPFLAGRYGNPSSAHALGRDAMRAVDEAREQLADLLGCAPSELVFTSGGTEADVHAVTGGIPTRADRVVCSAVEHPAVLATVTALGGSTVAVHRDGRIDLDALAAELSLPGKVGLVSVMAANNEIGTLNDLAEVAAVVAEHAPGAALHTDAVQAAAWLDLRRVATPAALVSVSAHKFGGPRGVGALVVRSGTPLRALLPGGGQELGRRSGTTHVAGIVGMAAALSALDRERDEVVRRVSRLRDRLESELGAVPGVVPTVASSTPRLAGTAHLLIDDVDSEPLLFLLDDAGVAASAASACASGAAAASHVLAAIGADAAADGRRRGALRLTLGHDATDGQVDRAVEVIAATVERLRAPVRRLTPDREG